MAKVVDLTGQKFNKLTVIKKIGKDKNNNCIWECKCDCGNLCNAITKELKNGHKKSCGCILLLDRANDLTGQKFGRLIVIERDLSVTDKKGTYWRCKCECGNEKIIMGHSLKNGSTQSCGCLNKDIISQQKEITNMIGIKYGKLTVMQRHGTHLTSGGQKKVTWLCKCDCGNEKVVSSQSLKAGRIKSCGCIPTKSKGDGLIDLVDKRFGNLVVLERAEDYKYKNTTSPRWLCKCDCGNTIISQGGNLRSGATTNCGCKRICSKGEEIISDFLTLNNITFLREYYFDDLKNKNNNYLRFDFAILNNDNTPIMLIEYQGEQHYIDCGEFGSYQRKYSDPIKKEYCKSKNIPLYEIKYNDNLEYALSNLLSEIKNII